MFDTGMIVRKANKNDLQGLSELIYRFYAFNEEFDSSWAISPNAREEANKMAENMINDPNINVYVAVYDNLLIGYIKSITNENPLLINNKIEIIKELYVKPQMRRSGIASLLIQKLSEEISKKGVKYIAVEFPVQNWIATDLYKKLGFRPYSTTYIKEV
ncbi:acetyltransferase [Caldisphaera lagunensis DSM 15908]|uniref:Acetyltransferase n=1 Tax=Caldisphaera lagunensis (strain DSM 15908 / JCM 11604 / ANMR 0165 / IC-154) TaxID=1056495 RepID=L0A833_CALLD|nr:GNAT family N-acetyltransferase [Caldisphaera lagunensis]AFZ70028.1 acetyltransferase [Caldisphaera lagunensis DSM 15908]